MLPYEYAEEHQFCPGPAPTLGGPEATATTSRAHTEIERLPGASPRTCDWPTPAVAGLGADLRSCLYGLHTVLRLRFSQEEEACFSLAP
ncbi:hypothetical protein PUR34_02605 [Streptomyces sp. JV185]|nr:hypothetical protein [Streptomyces sp. JV185]MEE1767100.1 hypothetical protein [Streptomyces sp. JV185]